VGQGYAGEGRTWRRGDLHVHSTHSDGVHTPLELAQHAREIGLDFLAITDHNTTSAAEELIEAERLTGVALLIGQELTTDVGYATVLGRSEPVDFRRQPDDWVSLLDNASTIFINHPVRENGGWRARTTIRLPALELWNGAEPLTVDAPVIDWWRRYGLQTVPLGGSGWHRAGANAVLGRPTTWLPVLGTDYVEAVKRGRVAITATPDGPSILRHDGEIVIQGAVGCRVHSLVTGFDVLRRIESSTTSIAPCPGPLLLIDQADDVVALCS
jgi:hypothetical protein